MITAASRLLLREGGTFTSNEEQKAQEDEFVQVHGLFWRVL